MTGHPQLLWVSCSSSHHPHCEKFLPYIQYKSNFFQFKIIAPCPVTTSPGKKRLSVFLISPLYILKGHNKVTLEPSLLQAEQPQLSQPFFTGEAFQPSDHFLWPSSGSAVTSPCPSCTGDPRAGRRTPGGVSLQQSRGAESPPLPCWPQFVLCSPGYRWPSGL